MAHELRSRERRKSPAGSSEGTSGCTALVSIGARKGSHRFGDGQEHTQPLVDPAHCGAARPAGFRWDRWAESGGARWQGGTLQGVASKLEYLTRLGVTTVWLGPIFEQRRHEDTYHDYAIQDCLEIDPHLGTPADRVALSTPRTRTRTRWSRASPHLVQDQPDSRSQPARPGYRDPPSWHIPCSMPISPGRTTP